MRVLTYAAILSVALGIRAEVFAQEPPAADKCSKKPKTVQAPLPAGSEELPPADPRLRELYDARKRFEEAAAEYRGDIHELITGEYLVRRSSLEDGYDEQIADKARSEEELRATAIAYFESFLAAYPDNREYTPGALYRLAELYFERDNLGYLAAEEQYQADLALFDKKLLEQEPAEPAADYTATIKTFLRLVEDPKFSEYENLDGAYYLLGYCLGEMGGTDDALAWFTALVERFPQSRFAPEAHLRLGEWLFARNDYDKALERYAKVLEFGEGSAYYDKALYKLGWTHYRIGSRAKDLTTASFHFESSIKRFKELLDYEAAGKGGSVLKEESLKYLEIDLIEDWNGDGNADWTVDATQRPVERANRYLDPAQPYTQLVLVGAGDLLFEQRYTDEAIAMYMQAVELFPLNPDNPKLLAKVVEALEREGRGDEALAVREEIGRRFGKDSVWASEQDEAVLESASALAEDALIRSATKHHEQGQELRAEWEEVPTSELYDAWQAEYRLAAELYKKYLDQYSTSENAYELSFFYAECLFYSKRFLEAADQYEKIRDSDADDAYYEEAAFSAIVALENAIKVQVDDGELFFRSAPPEPEEGKKALEGDFTEPFPAIVERLQANRDFFIEKIPIPCSPGIKVVLIEYNAALVHYNYGNFAEARRRFEGVIERHPKEQVALDSAKLLVDSYRLEGDIVAWQAAADKYSKVVLGSAAGPDVGLIEQKFGADFELAIKLYQEGKFEEASEIFIRLVDSRPDWEHAAEALNNAAVGYEEIKRYDSAIKYYERLVKEHGEKNDSATRALVAKAVYRIGFNAERFFEFDKAVTWYLKLVDGYKDFDEKKRLAALLAVASIKEDNREYAEAAKYYERLHTEFGSSKIEGWNPSEALFKAAEVRREGALYDAAVKTYQQYLRTYNDQAHAARVLEAHMRLAEISEAKGKHGEAVKEYKATVEAFDALVVAPGAAGSEFAAKARFMLVEEDLPAYEKISFKYKDVKKAEKAIIDKATKLKALEKAYTEVAFKYKSNDWSLAAFYRIGYLYEQLADTWYTSNPFKEGTPEYDEYQILVEDEAVQYEDKAVEKYKFCYEKGKELKVENEWTQKALERLNKYRGGTEYPLPKPPRTKVIGDAPPSSGHK